MGMSSSTGFGVVGANADIGIEAGVGGLQETFACVSSRYIRIGAGVGGLQETFACVSSGYIWISIMESNWSFPQHLP